MKNFQSTALIVICGISSVAHAAGLIFSEANAVGPRKWLNNANSVSCECANGVTCALEDDAYFGRVLGNGGDWIELVVTTDHLDIRGWKIRWAETDNSAGNADHANGSDIWYGNGNIEQGLITFSQNPLWADLRAGTILTITELSTLQGGLDTDTSFNPCTGDWWINVNASDSAYLATQINISIPSDGCAGPGTAPAGTFNVGNDNWQISIVNAANQIVLGPIGEGFAGGPGWAGAGVNSREVIRLGENPSTSVSNISNYTSANSSTFGKSNRWSETVGVGQSCKRYQDFRASRSWCNCGCAKVILNEYNAVGQGQFLNGGTAAADSENGQASDAFLGRRASNGLDWFELLVTDDHVDMRGWVLAWEEVADHTNGTIRLSNHLLWSNLRAGTIITFIRFDTANGGLNTDVSYNPAAGDRWININTHDATYIAQTTSNVPTHGLGDFHTSNDDWRLSIFNAASVLMSISTGEGGAGYTGRGVGNTEVFALEQDGTKASKSWDLYNASVRSTFGARNQWQPCPGTAVVTQSLTPLLASTCTKPADVNGNGIVNIDDLLNVINSWGVCQGLPCVGDVTSNNVVNIDDLLAVINNWG
jgi:hypothetical protein